jgi:hypothetical protein
VWHRYLSGGHLPPGLGELDAVANENRSSVQAKDAGVDTERQAAPSCGADDLVTNDRHLPAPDRFEGLRIIPLTAYPDLLTERGLLG